VVDTTVTGTTSTSNQFVLRTNSSYDITINWGDGSTQNIIGSGDITKTYASSGQYTIQISGTLPSLYYYKDIIDSANEGRKIKEITQWGDIVWDNFSRAFYNCINLNVTATDSPNLTNVQSMSSMFYSCTNLTGNTYFNNWNVSNVTNMNAMFQSCTNFNQPLSGWNVSNVTDMGDMFSSCTNFNQPLSGWNVSNVTDMSDMFSGCNNFNQPLNNWNVSGVTNMSFMFYNCTNFNQPLNNWNVCNVLNMNNMFVACSVYDQDISTWKVPLIPSVPSDFSTGTPVTWTVGEKPQWGVSCP
jgi:surface protein